MPDRSELPAAVVNFVRERIENVEQLDVLTLIMKSPDRWWDAGEVAEELGLNPATARLALERLASGNLLAITVTMDVHYRFQPGTPELHNAGEEFADAWSDHRTQIVGLVTDRQRRAMRNFADAFRIRRK
jgi:hypothetical protein